MELSKEIKIMIAKSGDNNSWLPLWMHSLDTAKVMKYLLCTRYPHICDICDFEFETLSKVAVLLACLHDIGKLTPLFQSNILKSLPDRRLIFEKYGIDNIKENFIKKEKSHHTLCGEAILLDLKYNKDFSSIVGAHHGMPAENVKNPMNIYDTHYYGEPINKYLWDCIYKEWSAFSLDFAGFEDIAEIPKLNKRTMVILSGLLIMADWIASDQTRFELLDEDIILSEYPKGRFEKAINDLNFPEIWEATQEIIRDNDFIERFSFSMNEVQKTVVETIENCDFPGLVILEAPMGCGKTEAALAMAEILAYKCEKTGIFFGLPTQATANGIFDRFMSWASLQSADTFHSINLAHGNAEFQPDFMKMKEDNMPQVDNDGDSGLVVHSFFTRSKMSLLSDFVVGTVDKLLMAALKKKHAMLLHLGLSQKVVIVDECHAYDAYMNRYLDRSLSWMHEYKVPVILLSATLPSDRRRGIVNAYLKRNNTNTLEIPDTSYPRLTYTDGNNVKSISLKFNKSNKEVQIERSNDDSILEIIKNGVSKGACVGVICNTVFRAQNFAEKAKKISNSNVILYHSQFIAPDRMIIEDKIKEFAGKKSDNKRKGTVVVGTQVLEQSLDIDFDILITDLCPMDLLIQRIGRLHRHKRTRPTDFETPKCVVLGTDEFEKASEKIYSKWLLMRTNKLLPSTVNIPGDINNLVCKTYKAVEPNGKEEQKALDEFNFRIEDKKSKASSYLMSVPRDSKFSNTLHGWLNNGIGNEAKAQASVRDGISSIEVIVLVKNKDGTLSFLPNESKGEKFIPSVCPSNDECKLIAQQKLRLPSAFSQIYNEEKTIGELEKSNENLVGFQKSHWLKGELFLLLNEELQTSLNGYDIKYSQENGLSYTKIKKEDKK